MAYSYVEKKSAMAFKLKMQDNSIFGFEEYGNTLQLCIGSGVPMLIKVQSFKEFYSSEV